MSITDYARTALADNEIARADIFQIVAEHADSPSDTRQELLEAIGEQLMEFACDALADEADDAAPEVVGLWVPLLWESLLGYVDWYKIGEHFLERYEGGERA